MAENQKLLEEVMDGAKAVPPEYQAPSGCGEGHGAYPPDCHGRAGEKERSGTAGLILKHATGTVCRRRDGFFRETVSET